MYSNKYIHIVVAFILFIYFGCSQTKSIIVDSSPSNANIFINDVQKGQTPYKEDLIFSRTVNSYSVKVTKDGYKDATEIIKYEPAEKRKYILNLENYSKFIVINSNPTNSIVYINGTKAGITPLKKSLIFNNELEIIQVVLEKKGFKESNIDVGYKPIDQTEYTVTLEKISKIVEISSHPSNANIFIDGTEVGITPLKTELFFIDENITKLIKAKMKGYNDEEIIISLHPITETVYNIYLQKSDTVMVQDISYEPTRNKDGTISIKGKTRETLAYREVIERSPNVQSVTKATNNKDESLIIGPPVISPVEDILIYRIAIKEKDGSTFSNIWKQRIGSFGKTKITYGKWEDAYPTFTPDGSHIVFNTNRSHQNPRLWKIKTNGGGGIVNITNSMSQDYNADISNNGDLVVYTSWPPDANEPQIWTINIDGRLPTQLREGHSPRISPDDNMIVFVRKDKDSGMDQIWIMQIDGSGETQLTQNTTYNTIQPIWSPNAKYIAFASSEGLSSKKENNYDIWLMLSDGSQKTQLTTNGSMDDSPCWDRTGEYIYFRSNRGICWNIWRFKPLNISIGNLQRKKAVNIDSGSSIKW